MWNPVTNATLSRPSLRPAKRAFTFLPFASVFPIAGSQIGNLLTVKKPAAGWRTFRLHSLHGGHLDQI
jgi:hypothetical protein